MPIQATLRKTATPKPIIDVASTVTKANPDGDFDTQLGLESAKAVNAAAKEAGATSEERTQAGIETLEPSHTSTAVVPRTSSLPAEYSAQSDPGGLSGEWGVEDIKLPRLIVVNGSGPLSQEYAQGTVLLAGEQLLGAPDLKDKTKNPVVRFVPVDIFPQYRENLTQDERDNDVMPRVVNTRAEAMAFGKPDGWLGGMFDYVKKAKPRWGRSGRCVFLIEEPEGTEHPGFSLVLDGKNWAPAIYYGAGTAWDGVQQIANTARSFVNGPTPGKHYLPLKVWSFQIIKKPFDSFAVFLPTYTLTKELTGPELREHIKTMVSPSAIRATEHAQ